MPRLLFPHCGSTSTVTFTSCACVVHPAAVYMSWIVSPAFAEKLSPVADPEPEPFATTADVLFVLWATSRTKNCGAVVQLAGADNAITLIVVTFSGVLFVPCEKTTFALFVVAPS